MEYQLKTKTSEASDFDPRETLLALFEGRISPERHQFELVEFSSGTAIKNHEYSSLSFRAASGSVRNVCDSSTIHSGEEFPSLFGATDVQEGI